MGYIHLDLLVLLIISHLKSGYSQQATIVLNGIKELEKGDSAIVLYVWMYNPGTEPVLISGEPEKCCLQYGDQKDCDTFKVTGGDETKLFPGDSRNLTFFFPNIYLHNRKGECSITLKGPSQGVIAQKIKFDTSLKIDGAVPKIMKDYYKPGEEQVCTSIDEDPLNHCKPYICLIRYSGKKNYFNNATRRCIASTSCESKPDKNGLPSVAYNPHSNTCTQLDETVGKEDMDKLKEGKISKDTTNLHGFPINVDCHHGKINPAHGWCECNEGWVSAEIDMAIFNPDSMVVSMCSEYGGSHTDSTGKTLTKVKPLPKNIALNIIVLASLIGAFTLTILVFCVLIIVKRINAEKEESEEDFE